MGGNIPGNVLNNYCWIMATFSVPAHGDDVHGQDNAYHGVKPYKEGGERKIHAYYQWVPFVLFFQGLLFYIPHWLWKTLEDRKLSKITENLRGRTLNIEDRKEKCHFLVQYTIDTFHSHNLYALKYFLCDALNLVNVIGQMFLINRFLGGVFMTYGTDVINWSESAAEQRTDPMIDVFPRVTKCSFHKYGVSGTIEKHDAMCVLALNIIKEKIYIFLWFWFILLASTTSIFLVYRIAIFFGPGIRVAMIQASCGRMGREKIEDLVCAPHLSYTQQIGDFFLLHLISKNVEEVTMKELVEGLHQALRPAYTEAPTLRASAKLKSTAC